MKRDTAQRNMLARALGGLSRARERARTRASNGRIIASRSIAARRVPTETPMAWEGP